MSKNDMVMVTRDLVEGAAEWLESLSDAESAEREVAIALRGALRQQHQGEPVAWVRFRNGEPDYDGDACMIMNVPGDTLGDGDSWEPVYTRTDPGEVERLRERMLACEEIAENNAKACAEALTNLAEAHALLRELAEAAEVFSCSAHCETSDAGDALELLNTILARVDAHKAPKCRVCGHKLHADGYCSFRDCGVPGRGTRALSASAEPSAPVECDERADFERHVILTTGSPIDSELKRHPVRHDEYACRTMQTRWNDWQARAALERRP